MNPPQDFVTLHKNINVSLENGAIFPIPELLTRPSEDHFNIEDSPDGLSFLVRLKENPRENDQLHQPLMDNLELSVLQSYSVAHGFSHMPHRWPLKLRRTLNLYLNINAMPESQVKYLSFMELHQFWEFCEVNILS